MTPSAPAQLQRLPRLIAWEVTRSCMLACRHCRGAAETRHYSDELTTEECIRVLDNIASFARPIIILTGGEPMLRADIYDIAAHARSQALSVVMAPCGTLLDEQSVARIVASGIRRISISLDGATAGTHDSFRGVDGAFESACRGIQAAKRGGLSFQVNTTVSRHNLAELPDLLALALRLGAEVFNPFLLVPTGRGAGLADQELSAEQYEQALNWLAERQTEGKIPIRVTCAPHFQRVLRQKRVPLGDRPARGCMGGQSFAFISHRGKVQICGFLDVECGDLRKENLDFRRIWETSDVFRQVRDTSLYRGRCGRCEYVGICGGCRARAYALTGDYLGEEPLCSHQPRRPHGREGERKPPSLEGRGQGEGVPEGAVAGEGTFVPAAAEQVGHRPQGPRPSLQLPSLEQQILSVIQTDFPADSRPYDVLAERLDVKAEEVLTAVSAMRDSGLIRRLGAVFDSRALGYVSTLVAARVPPADLPGVAALVSACPGVTHNYRRDHLYNLWFTLTAESQRHVDRVLGDLRTAVPGVAFHSLPAATTYKIRAAFSLQSPPRQAAEAEIEDSHLSPGPLDEEHKKLIRLLQGDLARSPRPFAKIAQAAGTDEAHVLDQVRQWLAAGVIRRLGAIVRHRTLGFTANGMVVFQSAGARVDYLGRLLAKYAEVSHCYRRPALVDFPYELYAMVHGRTREEVLDLVRQFAKEQRVAAWDVLFSTEEFKKVSPRYFEEPPPGGAEQG